MLSWELFKELCNLCFAPKIRNACLSELTRMPFHSTVQDYSDRFNTVLCHAQNLSAPQKDKLFVGSSRNISRSTWSCGSPRTFKQPCA